MTSACKLEIARTMEKAQDPSDALHIYKTVLHRHPTMQEALDGAGRTAFELGRYLEAKRYLARALEELRRRPGSGYTRLRKTAISLNEATRLLLLYPSSRLNPRERNNRILTDRKLAMARLGGVHARQSLGAGAGEAF